MVKALDDVRKKIEVIKFVYVLLSLKNKHSCLKKTPTSGKVANSEHFFFLYISLLLRNCFPFNGRAKVIIDNYNWLSFPCYRFKHLRWLSLNC